MANLALSISLHATAAPPLRSPPPPRRPSRRLPSLSSSSSPPLRHQYTRPNACSLWIQDAPIQGEQHVSQRMREWISEIKNIFQSMSLGEVSVSPYDTAWVAMVPALNGTKSPQFPKCLDWIIENQLQDGSWGDKQHFLVYERVLSTIACMVALKTWNISHKNIQKGVEFIHRNINKINEEENDYMPTAFEVVFPTMLYDAKELGIDLPYDSPVIVEIQKERQKKLNKISMDLLHTYPTTLLHSLEGLHRSVNWKRLLKLQTKGGSFLFSPASTACALKYTGDLGCLSYLEMTLKKFKNAVPSVYPLDMFEHIWMVDRLERLGISRYFKKEIKECLDYVYRYWTPRGIAWAKESNVFDVDDTAMGFRVLRLHGYHVSPEVFLQFKRKKKFICFEGQTSQSISGMHNLYRASQIMLPNEAILEEAKNFTKLFLIDKQKQDKIHDKWVISKGLKDEVAYTLKHPWAQSLPRIEARNFINHYGVDDVWIAKSLYSWDPMKVKGFSKEMRILFNGLYNTVNMINQEALKYQGRDISIHLQSVWLRYLKSIYQEANWKFLNHCPTLEEYMNNAKYTAVIEPILDHTLFFLGEKISEHDLKHKDYLHILDLVSTITRLNNDIHSFEREFHKERKWSSITIYLKENPNSSKLESIQHFKKLSEDAMKALVMEYLKNTSVSRQCKQIYLNMAKIVNLYYSKIDGYTSMEEEMSQHVKNTLYIPIA